MAAVVDGYTLHDLKFSPDNRVRFRVTQWQEYIGLGVGDPYYFSHYSLSKLKEKIRQWPVIPSEADEVGS